MLTGNLKTCLATFDLFLILQTFLDIVFLSKSPKIGAVLSNRH